MSAFWEVIDTQLDELTRAGSADEVLAILSAERNPYEDSSMVSTEGFFAGGGGDCTPGDSLRQAGWVTIWAEARYYWAMRAPDGSAITYVEGDIYHGDRKEGR